MGRVTIDDIIEIGIRLSRVLHLPVLNSQQKRGLERIKKSIEEGGLTVGIGPPGTGKTIVFSTAYAEGFEKIDRDEVVVHVAPTNRLVEETAVRTVALLFSKGYNSMDLKNAIRVYGSQFEPKPLDEDVKLVFTTGYQPGALVRLSKFRNSIHIMIDEASRTAFHEAFISLSMALVNEIRGRNIEFIGSFNVIGDPMQAIVEPVGTRWKYEQLIVYRMMLSMIPEDERGNVLRDPSKIFELAEKYAGSSGIGYFLLDKTYRMPKPTEVLVSIPFYDRKLEAVRSYSEVLKGIINDSSQAKSFINESNYLRRHSKVRGAIDNALESLIPVVYIRDVGPAYSSEHGRSYMGLDEYDELRSRLGGEVTAYLALRTCVRTVMLVAPYNEIIQQARWYVRNRFNNVLGERIKNLSFGTVHSVLGSEADIVVAVLGKEYVGTQHETMYFQVPELINVQLSRHCRMLVIIGNVERLAKNMHSRGEGYEHVGRVTEAVEDLKKSGLLVEVKI